MIARPFDEVQIMVARWIANKVVIGHELGKDLQVGNFIPGRNIP